jgi:hypothetical protein
LTGGKKNACTGHFHGSSIRQLSTAEADGQGIRLSPAGAFGPRVERLHASQLQSTIDPHDGSGNTPLHLACQHGHFDCAELLVSSQADLQVWGCTAMSTKSAVLSRAGSEHDKLYAADSGGHECGAAGEESARKEAASF